MTWSSSNRYAYPTTVEVRTLRESSLIVRDVEPDLAFDAAAIDSLVRGLPLGLITVLRAHDGKKTVEVVIDGARRVQAIRRHLFAEGGGLFLDFDANEVVDDGSGKHAWPTGMFGDSMALWVAQQGLGRGPMANRLEAARNAMMDGALLAQTVIMDDPVLLLRRLGNEDRADWVMGVTRNEPGAGVLGRP